MQKLTLVLCCALLAGTAFADKAGKRPVSAGVAIFAPADRQVIYDYYRGPSGLPPGLAKRNGNLPPGLAKQLQRNGRLPPGLQKKIAPFPVEVERRLAPLPRAHYRGVLGHQATTYDPRPLLK